MELFKCKTSEAYIFKILNELLSINIRKGRYIVDAKGIRLKENTLRRTMLFDINLPRKNFSEFEFNSTHNHLDIGIDLSILYKKILKHVKKKDVLRMFVRRDKLDKFFIETRPIDGRRVSTSKMQIIKQQRVDIRDMTGYNKSILIDSSGYSKMCKELSAIDDKITVSVDEKNNVAKFTSIMDGDLTSKETILGNTDVDYNKLQFTKGQQFDIQLFLKICKISGLTQSIHLYYKKDSALLFEANVGTLGTIRIAIKSITLAKADEDSKLVKMK